jgi:hypothetical protein
MLADRDDGWNWKAATVRAGRYLIALAGLGALAAGCGTVHAGRTSTSTPDTLMAAVSHTATQSARIEFTTTTQIQGMSTSFTMTGEFDFAHSRGMISMAGPLDMTELFLPPKVYLKVSDMGSSLPHGKTWIAIDTGASSVSPDEMLGLTGIGGNPADMLESLMAVAGSERIVGSARVRGVLTTEYQVNVDPAKMAAKAPASDRASLRQFTQTLGKGTIPVEVWVDSHHQVRQVRLSLHLPDDADAPANARLTETLGFYDFGVPVRISAPPASQVASESAEQVAVGSVGIASASAAASAAPAPPAVSASAPPAPTAPSPAVSASPAQG